MSASSHPVVVDLLQGLVADGALEDDTLEGVALVAGYQLHTNHLPLAYRHVAEHLHTHIYIYMNLCMCQHCDWT